MTSSEEIVTSVDKILSDLIINYQNTNEVQRVDFRSLCNGWDWTKRSDVYTHYFHKYPAKLLPYIPILFLSSSLVSQDDLILDPTNPMHRLIEIFLIANKKVAPNEETIELDESFSNCLFYFHREEEVMSKAAKKALNKDKAVSSNLCQALDFGSFLI